MPTAGYLFFRGFGVLKSSILKFVSEMKKNLDGVGGLEPPNDRIKIYCLTNLAIPQQNKRKAEVIKFIVEEQEKISPECF